MYCKNCGNKNEEDAKFCGECGTVVSDHSNIPDKDSTQTGPEILNPTYKEETSTESYIAKIIHAKSRRRLYFGYSLLTCAIIIFIYQHTYIANLISGPRLMDSASLENELIGNNIKDINVNLPLPSGEVYTSGYTYVTTTTDQDTNQVESQTTDSEYYLTIIGKHVLVLEGTPGQLPSGNFTGVVIPLPPDLQSNLVSDFNSTPELSGLGNTILPYALSNEGMTGLDDFWGFLFGLGLLLWGGFITYKRKTDPEDKKHYIYQTLSLPLSRYQNINDLSDDFIKSEQSGITKIGLYKLSNKFLFHETFFHFRVYPMSQMYWAYKKITKKSVNFIPTGKDYGLVMHFKPKQSITIKEPEASVTQHLTMLINLCPQAKFGYTK
jgi:hypothetical protein